MLLTPVEQSIEKILKEGINLDKLFKRNNISDIQLIALAIRDSDRNSLKPEVLKELERRNLQKTFNHLKVNP